MSEDSGHIYDLATKVGELTKQIEGMERRLRELSEMMEKQRDTNTQIRLGGRIAAVCLGIFGGAAGGKIAHLLGLLNDSAPHH